MSLKKYIQDKEIVKIHVENKAYQEKLYADLSQFLYKSSLEINEIKKKSINIEKLYEDLSEIHYPHRDQLCIAIASANIEKIKKSHNKFKEFVNFCV